MKGSVIISTHKIKSDQVYYKIKDNWVFCGLESAARTGVSSQNQRKRLKLRLQRFSAGKKPKNSGSSCLKSLYQSFINRKLQKVLEIFNETMYKIVILN